MAILHRRRDIRQRSAHHRTTQPPLLGTRQADPEWPGAGTSDGWSPEIKQRFGTPLETRNYRFTWWAKLTHYGGPNVRLWRNKITRASPAR